VSTKKPCSGLLQGSTLYASRSGTVRSTGEDIRSFQRDNTVTNYKCQLDFLSIHPENDGLQRLRRGRGGGTWQKWIGGREAARGPWPSQFDYRRPNSENQVLE